jgi:hypothetical protein
MQQTDGFQKDEQEMLLQKSQPRVSNGQPIPLDRGGWNGMSP